ncbi:clathrin light chain B-like isoform X1 [Ciona intestinalis]
MADLFDGDFMEPAAPTTDTSAVEEDPAAAFLAQQQDEIAGLESEVLGGNEPTVNGFGEPAEQVADAVQANDNLFDMPDNYGEQPVITNGGLEFEEPAEPEQMDPSQAYAAIAVADARLEELRTEPEKIRVWREENTKLLAEKDRESERKQQEWLAQARKELEDWDRNRLEQVEKTKESNRQANEAFLKQRDEGLGYTTAEEQFLKDRDQAAPGSEWERVSKLCEFNPKSTKSTKDVTRMRSTLLHLKQNPRPISVPEM